MRVAKISVAGRSASAVIDHDHAVVVGEWTDGDPMSAPFPLTAMDLAALETAAASATESLPLETVSWLTPMGQRSKVICLGLNYRDHADEVAADLPRQPTLFTKVPDALVGHAAPIVRPRVSEQFDYEGEIAVVIGRAGRHIAAADASDYVFGYAALLDGSVRDYQRHSVTAGKNFWHSGSLGPWIVTANEVPDPAAITLETRLNGATVQSTTADLMLYDIPTTIAYVSSFTELAPGDVISTGTPAGVGAGRRPPLWMRPGDRVEVVVGGVGVLMNPVEDE
jgi:2-keto-4-pentenoate hydratase/2-oxohepta-3-ene-1,7-dioic acid hydratase in catechol pathway